MVKLRHYSLAGNRWAYEEVAAGAGAAVEAASATAAAAAALGGGHDTYKASLGSAAVDVQLTFPGLTSAWFCESCAATESHDGIFVSEVVMCVTRLGSDQTCGDEALFTAARCVLQELIPKRILAEASGTVSGVSVYEVADTSAGHAALGLRVSVNTPAAAAAVAKALKRYQTYGATVAVPDACVAAAGHGGAPRAPNDIRAPGEACSRLRRTRRHAPITTFCAQIPTSFIAPIL